MAVRIDLVLAHILWFLWPETEYIVVIVLLVLAGPRFDASNNIIPHSILGDVDEFVSQAVQRGDLAEVKYFLPVILILICICTR